MEKARDKNREHNGWKHVRNVFFSPIKLSLAFEEAKMYFTCSTNIFKSNHFGFFKGRDVHIVSFFE